MKSKRQRSRLQFESLESRSMMASDYNAIVSIATLDLQNKPVSRVEIGESFKLRLSLENPSATGTIDYGVSGYFGVTFDPSLAEKTGDFQFTDIYSIGRNFDIVGPGEWEDIGAFPNLFVPEMDSPPQRRMVMEVEMKATAGGEVIFETNPSDRYALLRGIFPGYPNVVEFGYARLQIGDPLTYPSSPWRSPGDPSDVDGDGTVTEEDRYLLEIILGLRIPEEPYQSPQPREGVPQPESKITDEIRALMQIGRQGKISLDGSQVPLRKAPYLDVNGDRVVDIKDVRALEEEFQTIPSNGDTNPPLAFLMEPNFELEIQLVNERTQSTLTANSQVRVGDLIRVEWLYQSKNIDSLFSWLPNSHFQLVENQPNLIQVTKGGNFELQLKPDMSNLTRNALVAGVTPEQFASRLNELAASSLRQVAAQSNTNRPKASNHSYPFTQFLDLKSAREAVEFLSQPNALDLQIEASRGLLAGVKSTQPHRIMLTSLPGRGTVTVNDDGSFRYSTYDSPFSHSLFESLKAGDSFSYVLISPDGISEIRTVRIEPVTIPLLDLHFKAVDATGKPISTASVGQEFFLEISTFGNDNYRRMPKQFKPAHSLQFDFDFNSKVAKPVGTHTTPDILNWERYHLAEENGKLVLKTEAMHPEFVVKEVGTQAKFSRFSLVFPELTIFRQKVVATQAGPLSLALDDAILADTINDPKAIHIQVDKLVVGPSASAHQAKFDVSGNGLIDPLDALMVVNRLNAFRQSSTLLASKSANTGDYDPCDVNQDEIISPLDALLIINWLNLKGTTTSMGEGESSPLVQPTAADSVFAMPVEWDSLDHESRLRKGRVR